MTRERPASAFASPLLGLWIAFVAALAGCAQGVLAHEISYAASVVALTLLAGVIRLTASVLGVPAHPVRPERLAHAWWLLREAVTRSPLAAWR